MLDKYDQDSVGGGLFVEPVGDLTGEWIKAFAAGWDGDLGVNGHGFRLQAKALCMVRLDWKRVLRNEMGR